jgi:endonuclease/exonuclease/phosphatase family metal-dependent hydrolase
MGWGAEEVGAVGLVVFLTAFIAVPLLRLMSGYLIIVVTAGGLGLFRFLLQIWWGEPLYNLVLAMLGTSLFVIFLPTYLETARRHREHNIPHFAFGLLLGLALDTTLYGVFGTYDVSWQTGWLPIFITLILVLVQWVGLASIVKGSADAAAPARTAGDISRLRSFTWLAIGPFLFLELEIFQNIAKLATATGWIQPVAYGWAVFAHLAGLGAVAFFFSQIRRSIWPWALGSGMGLIIVLILPYYQAPSLTAALLLVGQVLLSILVAVIIIGVTGDSEKAAKTSILIPNGIGMVLFLVLVFGYYAVYDISLPYSNTILEPVAAGIVACCALGASIAPQKNIPVTHRAWAFLLATLILLIFPLLTLITWQTPAADTGEGLPIRIMTYNIHNGFNTDGYLGMEAIAQVIEKSEADIIALQEVSRGWVINGRLDMLTWLSQRLKMPYIFGPATGSLWGNAILSRYPITEYTYHELPPRDQPLLRSFIATTINVGRETQLYIIATHLHHINEDIDIRQLQAKTILDFWGSAGHTVLLGDLNADPDDPEMEMLRQGGFADAAVAAGVTPAYTSTSDNPERRIDYIWISSDLRVSSVLVPVSKASDHLPVIAVIGK